MMRFVKNTKRIVLAIFLLCAVVVAGQRLFLYQRASTARASGDFSIKTGYYLGTGAALSVTGLGFTPQVVIIKSDTNAGPLVWKSSAMPAAVTSYLGVATADNTDTEITLNSDGFTLSTATEVNTANVRFTYIALAGSDCSASGVFCVGSYTGNGAANMAVSTGFAPNLVWVKRTTAVAGNFRTSSMSANNASFFAATADDATGVFFQTLDASGFTVGATNNVNASMFYYVAFKTLAGKMAVGQFTGDGADNRNITGLGFEPDMVLVKQNAALAAVYNVTETWGDYSSLTTATANTSNNIQDLISDGFQVGNSTNVNALGIASNYFAFGGAPDPAPAGSFFMQRGSYTGNGTTQSITTSFAPDLVIVKGNTTQYAVFSTSLNNDLTHYFSLSAVGFSGGITAMSASDFSVGSSTTVNSNGITYEWIAFGNATSPEKPAGAADFFIGASTGNGITGRAIDHLGVAPSMVTIKRSITTAALANWRSSSMAANTSEYFSATADVVDGSIFQTLDSGGFTMGLGATANAAGGAYVWFGFKSGSYFTTGSYTGNGTASTDITGLGFAPDWVWVKRSTAVRAVHRSTSSTITGAFAQHFMNVANEVNHITGFVANGFTVGNSTEVNASGGAYQYVSWKSSTSSNPPSTPTNVTPANGASSQDLNTTLTGSAYSDPDLNPHLDTTWQVDDDSDFSSPVWTRVSGSAEITTSVTSGNGAFANELAGKTELDHASVYYWRVRYSDSVWSNWSTATNYTTNVITTPTNVTPADGSTVTTLTPTLMATAFADAQTGHTSLSAQWQLDPVNSFTAPFYDSGVVSYSNALAVPGAILADRNAYYWRVRYRDSSGQWSPYSPSTRFIVSESLVYVRPLFGSTVVDQGDSINIDAEVKLANGSLINDATVTINIYNPSGTQIVSAASMPYLTGSNGVYRYTYTVPASSGSYLYEVTAVSNSRSGYAAANFEARTIGSDVSSIKSTVESEQTAQTAERSAQATERADQLASRTQVTDIANNVDILLGAMVMTRSTINDAAPTATSFVTSLTNATNDFYKNAVLTFTSGSLDGQGRRISAYDGTTKTVTLDPALTSAPADTDAFTIVKQNVYVEEQLAAHESADATFRADTTTRLTDIETKIDDLTTTLNTVDANLDTVQTSINTLRASQQKAVTVTLSDVSEIQAGTTYRVKLMVLDYEGHLVDANTTPTVMIYTATRAVALAPTAMTSLSTGVYEYAYAVAPAAVTGLWETVASVDMGGVNPVIRNDFWQVTGAPAQVLINSISDLTVPSIAADVTITNEGGAAFEYQYEWCVVDAEDNQCGGGDDVYHATAAKLINAGEDFNTTLTATVPSVGDYWFKLVVYFGTEASGASRSFTAITEAPLTPGGGGGGGSNPVPLPAPTPVATNDDVLAAVNQARAQLTANASALAITLDSLGLISPNIQKLLDISSADLKIDTDAGKILMDLQNQLADLRAVSAVTRRVVEQQALEPIVETYMKFGSVEIQFLITNPDVNAQTVKFKAFLPAEVRPEHILNLDGLNIDYDPNAAVYFVSGNIKLEGKQSITKNVEMQDIWVFSKEELQAIKDQSATLLPALTKTQFGAQGTLLKSDIDSTISLILVKQEESYSSPQDHIVTYRENKARVDRVNTDLEKMKDLVTQAGATQGVVGEIGGIQTFATWGIVAAIVFAFGLLALIIFAMWRHQTLLESMASRVNEVERHDIHAQQIPVEDVKESVVLADPFAETTPEIKPAVVKMKVIRKRASKKKV